MGILPKCFGSSSGPKHSLPHSSQIEDLCHRFSLAQIRKSTNNFDEIQIIGRGGFPVVYKGCICINGKTYEIAVKRSNSQDEEQFSEFKNEIQLLCQLRHPNLVSLTGFCHEKNEMIVVYENLHNGSLRDHLRLSTDRHKNMPPLSWKKRLEICIGAARGLHYLHAGAKRSIFHLDVKPSNIFLDKNWVPKLADFAFSFRGPLFSSKPKPMKRDVLKGTYGYVAPEYMRDLDVTDKCDVYSFGVVLVETVSGKSPFDIYSEFSSTLIHPATHMLDLVKADRIIDPFLVGKIAPECLEIFLEIAERCLLEEPTARPAMGEVEVLLERVLELQEEVDITNQNFMDSDSDYSLVGCAIKPEEANNEGDAAENSNSHNA